LALLPTIEPTLEILADHGVEHIVVGGVAGILQGAPITTFDLDIVHRRTPANVARLLRALQALEARYRNDPRDLAPGESHLMAAGHNLLTTRFGSLDVLGTIGKGLGYEDLVGHSIDIQLATRRVTVLGLARLIEVKQDAGRAKDLAVLPTLKATLSENEKKSRI